MSAPASGIELLAARLASIPTALAELAAAPNPPLDLAGARRVRTTGVGSSQAHARFLADRLDREGAVRACFEPLSALAPSPPGSRDEVLVLFSQGLSPNVRPLLRRVEEWRRLVLVTAARERGEDERSRLLRGFGARGGVVRTVPGEDEYGTLMRVVGPMVGYLEALRFVRAVAGPAATGEPIDVRAVRGAIERAAERLDAALGESGLGGLGAAEHSLALLALGGYGELLRNLQAKCLEGMLLPQPPVWDLLEFAHGPFQQLHERPATLIALARRGAAERRLLDRLRGMLAADRHRLIVLESALPADLAIFEHEALVNALVLRYATERGIDPARWPGQGLDGPLYDSEDWASPVALGPPAAPRPEHRLDRHSWPELERAIARGAATAILPLGATEQHGPHLPLDTDTRIADALADRLCAEVEGAVRLPTIAIGCSSEHGAFPGTLSIAPSTLVDVLEATIRGVRDAGFTRLFVFSAHGGNYRTLRGALPRLRRAGAPLDVAVFLDLDGLTRTLQQEAATDGISPERGGHHAGEIETSILLALDPSAVRRDAAAAGFVAPLDDPQRIFYPSLRSHAPSGVVGDPAGADAARGLRYLARWAGILAGAYRGEKKAP